MPATDSVKIEVAEKCAFTEDVLKISKSKEINCQNKLVTEIEERSELLEKIIENNSEIMNMQNKINLLEIKAQTCNGL